MDFEPETGLEMIIVSDVFQYMSKHMEEMEEKFFGWLSSGGIYVSTEWIEPMRKVLKGNLPGGIELYRRCWFGKAVDREGVEVPTSAWYSVFRKP